MGGPGRGGEEEESQNDPDSGRETEQHRRYVKLLLTVAVALSDGCSPLNMAWAFIYATLFHRVHSARRKAAENQHISLLVESLFFFYRWMDAEDFTEHLQLLNIKDVIHWGGINSDTNLWHNYKAWLVLKDSGSIGAQM